MHVQYVLFVSFFLHVSLLLREWVADLGSCADASLSKYATPEDLFTAKLNLQSESAFKMAAVGELMCMIVVLAIASGSGDTPAGSSKVRRSRPLLHVFALVLPLVLACIVVGVRLRHTGIAGCAPGDMQCCDNMYCPSAHKVQVDNMLEWRGRVSSYKEVPGCVSSLKRGPSSDAMEGSTINWGFRSAYCPTPYWFSDFILQHCQQLYNFPDTAACYSYGCSWSNTANQYYSMRLLTGNAILFLVLATIAEV